MWISCVSLFGVLSLWVQFTVCGAAPWASHGRWEPQINFSTGWLLCVEWWSFGLWFLVVVLVGRGHVFNSFNAIDSLSLMAVIHLRRWLMGYVSSCWRSRKKQKSGKKEAWMVFWIALNSLHAWAGREINWFGFWKQHLVRGGTPLAHWRPVWPSSCSWQHLDGPNSAVDRLMYDMYAGWVRWVMLSFHWQPSLTGVLYSNPPEAVPHSADLPLRWECAARSLASFPVSPGGSKKTGDETFGYQEMATWRGIVARL